MADGRVVGVDVGGTGIKAALIGLDVVEGAPEEAILAEVRRPTPQDEANGMVDGDATLDVVAELVGELRAQAPDVAAVGLAVPGILDEENGVATYASGVGWRDLPVRDLLSERLGLPVVLGHDVRSAGLAEWTVGAARGSRDVLLAALGTGVGAAVVTDGRMLQGTGYAGQLGHIVADPDGPPCGCGQVGCLSRIASAGGVASRYADRTGRAVDGALEVARLLEQGDPNARVVWDEATTALGDALVTTTTLFGTELIVLGGGLSLAGEPLFEPVRRRLAERLTFQRHPRVVPALLGDRAGMLGAGLAAGTGLAAGSGTAGAGPAGTGTAAGLSR